MIAFPTYRGVLHKSVSTTWTPQDLSPIIWIDPNDSSTLFNNISGGSLPSYNTEVHRVANKAAGYTSYEFLRDTTGGGLVRKQGTAATNYKDYFYGSAVSQGNKIGSNEIGKNAAGVTAFVVCQCSSTSITTPNAFFQVESGGSGLNRIYLDAGRNSTNKLGIISRRVDSGSGIILSTSTSTPSNLNVFGGKFEFASNKCSTYVNSTTVNSENLSAYGGTGTNCANTNSLSATIAGFTNSGTINIGEIIVVNRALTSTEMTNAFSYLNAKWRNA